MPLTLPLQEMCPQRRAARAATPSPASRSPLPPLRTPLLECPWLRLLGPRSCPCPATKSSSFTISVHGTSSLVTPQPHRLLHMQHAVRLRCALGASAHGSLNKCPRRAPLRASGACSLLRRQPRLQQFPAARSGLPSAAEVCLSYFLSSRRPSLLRVT